MREIITKSPHPHKMLVVQLLNMRNYSQQQFLFTVYLKNVSKSPCNQHLITNVILITTLNFIKKFNNCKALHKKSVSFYLIYTKHTQISNTYAEF